MTDLAAVRTVALLLWAAIAIAAAHLAGLISLPLPL